MHLIDVVALWLVWWCAAAALSAGHEVRTWKGLVLSLGLIVVSVSSFVGAIVVYMRPGVLPLWARGFVVGTAIVACWLYDHRFGIARHFRMVMHAVRSVPQRIKEARAKLSRRRV